MSKLYAPIDEKWLDRPRAKRARRASEDADKPTKKRQRSGDKEEPSDEEVDLLLEFRTQKKQEADSGGSEGNNNGQKDSQKKAGHQEIRDLKAVSKEEAPKENDAKKDDSNPGLWANDTKGMASLEKVAETQRKRAKTAAFTHQTNIASFFASSATAQPPKSKPSIDQSARPEAINDAKKKHKSDASMPEEREESAATNIPGPMIPRVVTAPRNVLWTSVNEYVIVRKVINEEPRDKVAAFDLDGTLTIWRIGGWPSKLEHFELWSSTVPSKLRAFYDSGFKLVLFTNQGAIRSAHNGKKATLVKSVIDWIAHLVNRPVHAVLSTKSPKNDPNSYHKPTGRMWSVATKVLNKGQPLSVEGSFFVGDSADVHDAQGGVDFRFAEAVSTEYGSGTELSFSCPNEHFGPSDFERRSRPDSVLPPPKEALAARAAILGGYYPTRPIVLLLCGVQGSGKSTFSKLLTDDEEKHWVHLSQDTINNGKPGKREKVEAATSIALREGRSVVIDRMHLDRTQRKYFVSVARSANVPAHILVFNPSRDVVAKRVRERQNHPGKVMGDQGVRVAMQSLSNLLMPTYDEGFELITSVSTPTRVTWLASRYKSLANNGRMAEPSRDFALSETLHMPAISLGTMGIKKKSAVDVVRSILSTGIASVDTAPTYNNEEQVGDALSTTTGVFCIGKIPKSVFQAEDVRPGLESTLKKLRRKHVDLLLLHWPSDVISAGTLSAVWREMEKCLKDGLCKALGVSNFNTKSLVKLLASCTVRPVVNQVERHPLLAQWDLIDFCERNDIAVQAHSPLGQGKDVLLENSAVQKVAASVSMSPAQVVLRWNLQHGVLVAPKCAVKKHAMELLTCKALDADDMKLLDSLDEGRRFVAPPFMYGNQEYCWGERLARK